MSLCLSCWQNTILQLAFISFVFFFGFDFVFFFFYMIPFLNWTFWYARSFLFLRWSVYILTFLLWSSSWSLLQCLWGWVDRSLLGEHRCSWLPSVLLLLLLSGLGSRCGPRGPRILASGRRVWSGGELVHHTTTLLHSWRKGSSAFGDQSSGEPAHWAPQHVCLCCA